MRLGPLAVTRALRRGAATLDALAGRTGAGRDELLWALDEAAGRGWVTCPADEDCGVCGSRPPAVYHLTQEGRRAVSDG